ncbi:DinB family protein [Streptomyces piniterrae]|uniref:DinB family protein n=2 Tax=Streptomyces piniterrae TaxID=2571125 RepID=A0A4U0N924_9ACTN|nr:DinB family protein [Streptomyces piniterrae]
MTADERTTLESWLDFHRSTLAAKCAGLDDEAARQASAEPSPITLIGLVQHLAEVERRWFRRVLLGAELPTTALGGPFDPTVPDGGFEVSEGATLAGALAVWQEEIRTAREACAGVGLDATGEFQGTPVSLRWIYVHMIEEYARHNGHADLIRERVDGATGV